MAPFKGSLLLSSCSNAITLLNVRFLSKSASPLQRRILVKDLLVSPDESGMRLDRFLKHRLGQDSDLTAINHSLISQWLRKRQVRLLTDKRNDSREQAPLDLTHTAQPLPKAITVTSGSTRTEAGQVWRVRALWEVRDVSSAPRTSSSDSRSKDTFVDVADQLHIQPEMVLPLQDWIVYKDERIIILNKPAGIAVQGGTGVVQSVDDSLPVLQYEYPEKPRIVHRLDKTTSGLLILARTRKVAQDLSRRFHGRNTTGEIEDASGIRKKYFAIVGSKKPIRIPPSTDDMFTMKGDMAVVTQSGQSIHMMQSLVQTSTSASAIRMIGTSLTDFRIASQSFHNGSYWALLHLYPRTGRKHQLRVHCAQLLNAPILGDNKYDGTARKDGAKNWTRIYLHMAEVELKDWFKSNPTTLKTEREAGECSVLDGSLVVSAAMPEDMVDQLNMLELDKVAPT
ncbi:hypothetical protein BGX34_008564 [Mortierella sp. NVP85]|nr:hypothetical protein BGX34_008564 [Mortierella sp. NVP85]